MGFHNAQRFRAAWGCGFGDEAPLKGMAWALCYRLAEWTSDTERLGHSPGSFWDGDVSLMRNVLEVPGDSGSITTAERRRLDRAKEAAIAVGALVLTKAATYGRNAEYSLNLDAVFEFTAEDAAQDQRTGNQCTDNGPEPDVAAPESGAPEAAPEGADQCTDERCTTAGTSAPVPGHQCTGSRSPVHRKPVPTRGEGKLMEGSKLGFVPTSPAEPSPRSAPPDDLASAQPQPQAPAAVVQLRTCPDGHVTRGGGPGHCPACVAAAIPPPPAFRQLRSLARRS